MSEDVVGLIAVGIAFSAWVLIEIFGKDGRK